MGKVVNLNQIRKDLDELEKILKRNPAISLDEMLEKKGEEVVRRKTKADDGKKSPNTVHLPAELWDKVRHKAVDEKTTISGIIEKALLAYLSE